MRKKSKYNIKTINFKKKRALLNFLIILFAFLVLIISYLEYFVNPLIVSTSESKIKVLANRSMNIAVTTAMNQDITYDDLIHLATDSNGKISIIQANSVQINSLAKMITRISQENLVRLTTEPVEIPLGAFTGIAVLSNFGPIIKFNIRPFGDIHCKFNSEFISAGINQTQHKIYLNILMNVSVILPFKKISVDTSSSVLVCESVIIGDIPETYLKSDSLDEMMNLIPM